MVTYEVKKKPNQQNKLETQIITQEITQAMT